MREHGAPRGERRASPPVPAGRRRSWRRSGRRRRRRPGSSLRRRRGRRWRARATAASGQRRAPPSAGSGRHRRTRRPPAGAGRGARPRTGPFRIPARRPCGRCRSGRAPRGRPWPRPRRSAASPGPGRCGRRPGGPARSSGRAPRHDGAMAEPTVADLAAQSWDAVVVGGGHNGLTAAAYLARAGRSVAVLERRDQLGGACTLERPFSDPRFVISPCAYLVGLLHPLVIEELELPRYGYRTFVCDPTQWTPFEDGTSLTQWLDEDRTAKEIDALAAGDVEGYLAYVELFRRIRSRLRAGGDPARDTWVGDAPVVSNADPVRTLGLFDGDVPEAFRSRVDAWRCESPVVKVNCALSRLPTFTAAADRPDRVYRAQVEIARGIDDTQKAYEQCRRGEPAPEWCEIYFQTAYDPSVAPPGAETMSVFAQYAPYSLAAGTWDTRRDEIGDRVLEAIARFAPDVAECVVEREVLGPPDVEARVGLTGGHIFQGECLPDQMWDRRFASRTPVAGLYLCGAATHPGGSVIGVNGRNAALAVLVDRAGGA